MAMICPTVTAFDNDEYKVQIERLVPFAKRVHIDLMDGKFAPSKSPGLDQVWWPESLTADIHLMYQRPAEQIDQLIRLKPNLVVIHFEADVDHLDFSSKLIQNNIKAGLAILSGTPVDSVKDIMHCYDHILVFSGKLGHHGGKADLKLLDKVRQIREHYLEAEISWDGGISDKNAQQLVEAGVNILNVGGFIQKSSDPQVSFTQITEIIK